MSGQNKNTVKRTRFGEQGDILLSPCGRPFQSSLPPTTLATIQAGVMRTTYRNRAFLKSPFDIALYLRLLERLRPRTVIEIGSKHGGSALWFSDTLNTIGVEARIISIDVKPPTDTVDSRILFLQGDAASLETVLTADMLAGMPHPWLVSEDSAHRFRECLSVLKFFDFHLAVGDYIVIEDGIVSDMPEPRYSIFENGPNRAVAAFLSERSEDYAIDAELCDSFGYNATYNPNGWLRRIRAGSATAVDASARLT